MSKKYALVFASLVLSFAASTNAQPLFERHDPLDITLTGAWAELAKDSNPDPESRPATLTLTDGTQFNLKVAPRGKSRRRKDFCDFPPLRLDFKRAELAESVFAGQNKLKLVTHCGRLGTRNTDYSDRLHSEYLLYRVFNLISPRSFAVRSVNITYVDSVRNKSYNHPGFIIEHKRALTSRLNASEVEQPRIPLAELDGGFAANAALFAFFAGNTDFSFTAGPKGDNCCHNAVPLRIDTKISAIPYDFDSTGFVQPPYAAPVAGLGLKKVTQRLHRGYCRHTSQVPTAIAAFVEAKNRIAQLITDHSELSERRKKSLLRYTERFFKVLENPANSTRRLVKTCR